MKGYTTRLETLHIGGRIFIVLIDNQNNRQYLQCPNHKALNTLQHFLEIYLLGTYSTQQKYKYTKKLLRKQGLKINKRQVKAA